MSDDKTNPSPWSGEKPVQHDWTFIKTDGSNGHGQAKTPFLNASAASYASADEVRKQVEILDRLMTVSEALTARSEAQGKSLERQDRRYQDLSDQIACAEKRSEKRDHEVETAAVAALMVATLACMIAIAGVVLALV